MEKFIYNKKYLDKLGRRNFMIKKMYLIRHGETDWNRLRRVQGNMDIPLNSLGQEQADKLYRWFNNKQLDAIYSSDLSRAYHTACSLAKHYNIGVKSCCELRERSYGLIEGNSIGQFSLTHSEQANDWLEVDKYNIEPLRLVKQRMFNKIEEILQQHHEKAIAIVSHGGAIKAYLSIITHGEKGSGKIKIDNTAVTEIEYSNGTYQIVTLNDTSHLQDGQDHLVV